MSATTKRRSMPTVKAIHEYWLGEQFDVALRYFNQCDIGEPSCYCCGRWDYTATDGKEFTSFYERCHIVDHVLGGSETVDNLILLCRTCHWQMPRIAPGTPLEAVGGWIQAQRDMWNAQARIRAQLVQYELDDAVEEAS